MFSQPQVTRGAIPQYGNLMPGQLPVNGMNARDALARMLPDDAISLINVLSNPYGLTVRGGYQEWATGISAASVRTVMSYYTATAGATFETNGVRSSLNSIYRPMPRANSVTLGGRLFACTGGQIFDVTDGGTGPWVPQANVAADGDEWSWINFQNEAGSFLLAANHEGGYYIYGAAGFSDGFSDGFATVETGFKKILGGNDGGEISGINPDLFCYVVSWKRRLWFIEKDSTRAWYLPIEQLTGEARLFDFGAHFRHGGKLEMLLSWTVDGGEGIDDYLVAVSSQGDVVIFKGTDPNDAATFGLHGIWYVGALPEGRRCAEHIGGDLHLLSVTGFSQLSQLIAMGQIAQEMTENTGSKIDPLIRTLMQDTQNTHGWYLHFLPHEQMLVCGVPEQLSGEGVGQLAFKIRQRAWSILQDLPVDTFTNHSGLIFAGGRLSAQGINGAGNVYLMFDNALDNVNIDATNNGSLIKARITPSYSAFGAPGLFKRYTMLRPTFITQGPISAKLTVLTDYSPGTQFTAPTLPSDPGAKWDVGLWDVAKWSGISRPIHKWLGLNGSGYSGTCQIDFVASGGTKVTSLDWATVSGGIL